VAKPSPKSNHYDVVVVGSGFGGSVAALRLTEKGYRVLVIEAGSRFADTDFAKDSFDLKRFLFFPRIGLKGIQRVDLLKNVLVMSGAGVGGGSLVYANTLYQPGEHFFKTGPWSTMANWQDLLAPYFDQAKRMLGVQTNPYFSPSDAALQKVANANGYGETFKMADLGIHFGTGENTTAGSVPDPYFGGVGPARSDCKNCGECMTGCRHGAKNTLVKNYLYLAERAGTEVLADTTVTHIQERIDGGFHLDLRGSSRFWGRTHVTADQVVMAAGALGSAKLLQRVRRRGALAGLSGRLGHLSRTNSESLLGVVSRTEKVDFSLGSAITSSVFPSEDTHIEPVRYGRGSGFMGLLQSVAASGKAGQSPSPARLLWVTLTNLHRLPNFYNLRTWPQRTLILLVMQARDNSLVTYAKRRLLGGVKLTSRQGHGEENPAWVPEGHRVAKQLATEIDGVAGAVIGEPFGIPLTAHFLGGSVIAPDSSQGVVDGYLRAFGQPGLHIFDGSVLPANPGVNPSLSITAIAEWAAAHWPNKGEADSRPALDADFKVVEPVAPASPVVPAQAIGGLRLSITPRQKS
jgi:cholesterol oxidase